MFISILTLDFHTLSVAITRATYLDTRTECFEKCFYDVIKLTVQLAEEQIAVKFVS